MNNKKIEEKILKEVYKDRLNNYKDGELETVRKAISLAFKEKDVEIMKCEEAWFQKYRNTKKMLIQKDAEIKKAIDEEKEIVKMICLGLVHPSGENQEEFTKWLQDVVIFHLDQLKQKLGIK